MEKLLWRFERKLGWHRGIILSRTYLFLKRKLNRLFGQPTVCSNCGLRFSIDNPAVVICEDCEYDYLDTNEKNPHAND